MGHNSQLFSSKTLTQTLTPLIKRLSAAALSALLLQLLVACQTAFGDFTIDTSKLAVSCQSNATRCDGTKIESCINGNEWKVLATCPTADWCNLTTLDCTACQPGTYQCSDAQPQVCGPDQKWSAAASPCVSSALCSVPDDGTAANCKPPGCEVPGQLRCNMGNHLQRCPTTQTDWEDVEICASPALCNADAATARVAAHEFARCELPACSAGQFNCDTGSPRPCNADRTDWGAPVMACSSGTCNPDQGDCSECIPGTYACSGSVLERCSEQKTWSGVACSSVLLCAAAPLPTCTPPTCTPGQVRCDLSELKRCRSDGGDWESLGQCLNKVLCNPQATHCEVPQCPVAGATRCKGNEQQACRAELTGWSQLAQCPDTGSCDPDKGCLATRCTNGDYRCNDVSLELCVNQAWTRQAICATPALCDATRHVCTAPTCVPGDRQCFGNAIKSCNDAQNGWKEFATCGGGKACSEATKRCE
jgi:hypothetical protein